MAGPMETVQLVDGSGAPLGSSANPLAASTPSLTRLAQASLGSLNARLLVDVTGLASAMVLVEGAGNLSLKFSGTVDGDGVGPGGRRLWKAGVGSLGISAIDIAGPISSEYRVVLGGRYFAIDVPTYASGSVNVIVLAEQNSPVAFVHGPVHTALDEAVRGGKAYSAGTGVQGVSGGNFLNTKLVNPPGSGRNCFLFARRFENNVSGGSVPLEYFGVANPVTALGNALTPLNLRTGGPESVMLASWNMATARLDSSPSTVNPVGGILATNGMPVVVDVPRLIGPGQSFGHYVGGAGGGLAATARLGITWLWYEEDAF